MSVYVHGQSPAAQAQRILDGAQAEADTLLSGARREAMGIVSAARRDAQDITAQARRGAAKIIGDAHMQARRMRSADTQPTTKILAEAEAMRAASTASPAEGRARLQLLAAEVNAHHAATAARRRPATMANTPAPVEPEGRAA